MDNSDEGTVEPAQKHSVSLRGVTETLLIPLRARMSDANSPMPILGDVYAQQVMDKLDYDFTKVLMSPVESSCIAVRTRFFDHALSSFLTRHPSATILHLGCGLDSRVQRVDWGSGDVLWVDVDLPPVLALRRRVLPNAIPGRDYRTVSADVTGSSTWLQGIRKDRPTVVVMEGLLSYLTEKERETLLLVLVDAFQEGELFFDSISPLILNAGARGRVKAVQQTGAEYRSAIDDPKELEEIHNRLQHVDTVRFVEVQGVEMLPMAFRLRMYLLSWIPRLRDSARFIQYRIFPPEGAI